MKRDERKSVLIKVDPEFFKEMKVASYLTFKKNISDFVGFCIASEIIKIKGLYSTRNLVNFYHEMLEKNKVEESENIKDFNKLVDVENYKKVAEIKEEESEGSLPNI